MDWIKHLKLLLIWCLMILSTPITIVMLIVVYIIRMFESIVHYLLYRGKLMRIEDAAWTLFKTTRIINGFMELKGDIDVEAFRNLILDKLVKKVNANGDRVYPSVSSTFKKGVFGSYWIECKQFDISKHIYMVSNEPVRGEDSMLEAINNLCSKPLSMSNDISTPQWEFLLIPMLTSNGNLRTVLLLRLNHMIADGSSLAYFLVNGLADDKLSESAVTRIKRFTQNQSIMSFVNALWISPIITARNLLMKRDNSMIYSRHPSSVNMISYSKPISLDAIKAIKNRFNCTVNDVLLGCLTKTLHDHFEEHDKESKNKRFTILCPVNSRKSIPKGMGNNVAPLMFPLPTSTAETVDCIKNTHSIVESIKRNNEALIAHLGFRFIALILPLSLFKYFALDIVTMTTGSGKTKVQ